MVKYDAKDYLDFNDSLDMYFREMDAYPLLVVKKKERRFLRQKEEIPKRVKD